MDDQNKNLILATALSFIVILVWFVVFPPPEAPEAVSPDTTTDADTTQPSTASAPTAEADASVAAQTDDGVTALAQNAPRLTIDTPTVEGSISLQGGRIDQLSLKNYRETLEPGSDIVQLLEPVGGNAPYYALFGWAPGAGLSHDQVPNAETIWAADEGSTLTPDSPVTLTWDNGAGLTFERVLSVDEDFMFTVTQSVENTAASTSSLAPYGILARHGQPADMKNFFILHEGLIAMSDGELAEVDYDDVTDYEFNPREGAPAEVTQVTENGWTGFTDHYWMTTLIPEPGTPFKSVNKYDPKRDIYQTEAVQPTVSVEPGEKVSTQTRLFAGAKEWEAIRAYENEGGVERFLDSIDWGWFFFLTKPIFAVLHWLNVTLAGMGFAGSMGWAIIGLTLLIKALLLPLAYKSYVSMAKMKELQPQMEKIKETAGDDKQKLQQEMMALYKKEKVNPASGCLPILLQIPIFFSLY
jgi:YidC/Oxa1 family membrane protein insertase